MLTGLYFSAMALVLLGRACDQFELWSAASECDVGRLPVLALHVAAVLQVAGDDLDNIAKIGEAGRLSAVAPLRPFMGFQEGRISGSSQPFRSADETEPKYRASELRAGESAGRAGREGYPANHGGPASVAKDAGFASRQMQSLHPKDAGAAEPGV